MTVAGHELAGFARRFGRSQEGFVLVFLAVALPALLGLVGLALDGARFLTLDTELAQAADAAALAAATQLDGAADALPRARAAALILGNAPGANRPESRLLFRFAAAPADLRTSPAYTLGDEAGADATIVEVTTVAQSLTASFLQLVGVRSASTRRRAAAETRFYACDVTPLVLCQANPAAFAERARPGRQYLLRMDGNVVSGSVALLERPDSPSSRQVLQNVASDAPAFCYADDVRLRTNVAATEFDEALNIRFDRYAGRTGPIAQDLALYPPAPNVVTGRHLESCLASPQGGDISPPFGLPRDAAYLGFRPSGSWDAGTGDWRATPASGGTGFEFRTALDEYMAWNHADKGFAVRDRLRASPTRYDLYLGELGLTRQTETNPVDTRGLGASRDTMPTGGPTSGSLALRRENAVPVCYGGNRLPVAARRRILYLSVADCTQFPSGARADLLSRRVAKMFITEPSESGAMLMEFVAMLRPGEDDGKLRRVVRLVTAE